MNEPLAGTGGLPDGQSTDSEVGADAACNSQGRPHSTREEYERVIFLARVVLGFTVVAAAVLYYVRTARSVKQDLESCPELRK